MRSKGRAQELFRCVRGDVALLVVRPPTDYTARYEEDLDTLLDTQVSLCNYFLSNIFYDTQDHGWYAPDPYQLKNKSTTKSDVWQKQ